jgi:uncharacterized membrane protein YfcA
MAITTIWIGASALNHVDLVLFSALLGVLLVAYSGANLSGFSLPISIRQEKWAGPLVGMANGILTGMTGSFVVPGVMFLQAIGLSREALIQAMGILFALSTLALGIALQNYDLLTIEHGLHSTMGLLPAIAGMLLGQRIRKSIPEQLFRKLFFIALLMLGAYIIATAVS